MERARWGKGPGLPSGLQRGCEGRGPGPSHASEALLGGEAEEKCDESRKLAVKTKQTVRKNGHSQPPLDSSGKSHSVKQSYQLLFLFFSAFVSVCLSPTQAEEALRNKDPEMEQPQLRML